MGKKFKMRRKVFSFCICQLQLPRQSTTDREAPTTTDQEALTTGTYFSWEAGKVQDQGAGGFGSWGEPSSWLADCHLLTVSSHG